MKENKINLYNLPRIFTTKELSITVSVPEDVLKEYSEDITKHYRRYRREKNRKKRIIDEPDKPLKAILSKINLNILQQVVLPDGINGGVKKKSIKTNANKHVDKRVLVTVDIRDCYPSISFRRVFKLFREKFGYSREVASLLTNITTFRGSLPQGSPTSTGILNILLMPLFEELRVMFSVEKNSITFWVDDIAISGEECHRGTQAVIRLLQKFKFSTRSKKVKVMFAHQQQSLTNLTVNSKLSVKKEQIKKYILESKASSKEANKGRLTFIKNINSLQAKRLEKKLN